MTRKDRILIAGVLGCAAILAFFLYLLPLFGLRQSDAPDTVVVTVDGEFYGAWALSEDHEEDIDTVYGHNRLVIRDGCAQMTEADCPDKLCMHQGQIRSPGEMIVCLPHRVIAEIRTAEDGDAGYDGISE